MAHVPFFALVLALLMTFLPMPLGLANEVLRVSQPVVVPANAMESDAILQRLTQRGFTVTEGPVRRGGVYWARATSGTGEAVSLVVDARSGEIVGQRGALARPR
ncbi:MAG: hypothetical protein WCH83_14035 [Alphaproteobacteria bacterium]